MIVIDGSAGEGGGQVLRTSLALSLAAGRPFRIEKIRERRPKPGLMRQHLTSVQAAATVGQARVEGDRLGSTTLSFEPEVPQPGEYTFSVGTAGSATLVLQTILPPLLTAAGPSRIAFEGGTHNPWAPPFDFLDRVYLPCVRAMGPVVTAHLVRSGFYPAGGGRFEVAIEPCSTLGPFEALHRGEILGRSVRALIANLPRHIAEREIATALTLLNWSAESGCIEEIRGASGPGNVLMIEIRAGHAREILTGFGESGTPAEAVARRTVDDARRYLAAGVPVGCHLADQLLPLLALAGGGAFRTLKLSRHALTNADVIRNFLDVTIDHRDEARDVALVRISRK